MHCAEGGWAHVSVQAGGQLLGACCKVRAGGAALPKSVCRQLSRHCHSHLSISAHPSRQWEKKILGWWPKYSPVGLKIK